MIQENDFKPRVEQEKVNENNYLREKLMEVLERDKSKDNVNFGARNFGVNGKYVFEALRKIYNENLLVAEIFLNDFKFKEAEVQLRDCKKNIWKLMNEVYCWE